MASLLLVDDEPSNLLALRAVLEPLGHELIDARSGDEALRLLLDRQFSVILLDVRMPGMDGLETAALIRQRERTNGVPIVFLTAGAAGADDVARGYAEGATDYLVKPFNPDILRAKVQALVAAQEASMEAKVAARTQALLEREQRARAEAEAARRQAEEATRIKDQFISTLSHELRTPLMSILGWVRLLRLGKASADPGGRALASIERNARIQARLVEELLDVQRFATGKTTLSFHDVPFAATVESAVRAVAPEAEEKQVTLRTVLPPAEEIFVFGDSDRLQQMVLVLLRNAIKFNHPGGNARVVLSVLDTELVLAVSDDGRGMTAEFLSRAVAPFAQQDSRLTREFGGFGLGLYTARRLVELHGGIISAHSEGPGRGSTFQITLPFRSRVPRPFSPAAVRESHPAGARSLEGVSILVVDDDPDAQYLIATMLEQFGGRVTAAGSAAEGMDALSRGPFDLLLSDISMAGEDGYSFMQRIRTGAIQPRIPAVALTANAQREDRLRALAAGFQSHLAKPVEPAVLATTLADLVPPD